VLRKTIKLVGE